MKRNAKHRDNLLNENMIYTKKFTEMFINTVQITTGV